MHKAAAMGKIRRAIGLMSGTSMDGIDIAALDTDGDNLVNRLGTASVPYDARFRETLRAAIGDAVTLTDRAARPGCLAEVEQKLTELHVEAVRKFIARKGWDTRDIDVVGFHGQTVLHRPDEGLTVQLGDGPALATTTGIPVVYDLRGADVAAGGEGAPLAPAYHRAILADVADRPVAVVNIGGVANVTWIGQSGDLLAFDTGPGNALIDDWMSVTAGLNRDEGGAAAARGRIRQDILEVMCRHDYFSKPPPKSLDRNAFDHDLVAGLSIDDGAATLTAFTARTIAEAKVHMPQEPALWVITGGGRHNTTLMAMIADLAGTPVIPIESTGFDGDSVEAEAWAYLAVRSLDGAAITYPGTTGIRAALTGGIRVS